MENNFRFDKETHTYYLNGVKIPGFSEVAKAEGLSDYSTVRLDVMEAARKFGNAVHSMTALWDRKILNVEILDPALVPYLEGYKQFLHRYNIEIIQAGIEVPICSWKWKYGITPDRTALTGDKVVIYEIKSTSSMSPVVALQTAAQKIAVEENSKYKVKIRWGLQLLPNDFRVFPYENKTDETAWLSILQAYKWKRGNL
jgi:CRISPR/Cas system-associated exonuclease Cas4 (RecB family)